nr:alpha-copaene synthase-like [Lolium perenne]
MKLRVDELKQDVCMLFEACNHDVIGIITLVDDVQLLGIDHLFQDQIDVALRYIHEREFNSSSLYEVALRFRLLREHGLWVSPDMFGKFMNGRGSFSEEITNEAKGLLGLYNAAFLSVHGEPELEEAMSFARYHLESMRGELNSPLKEQVKRSLDIPLPRTYRRLETLHYFSEYEQEEGQNSILLELAKLEFTLLQYVHSKELKSLSRWDYNGESLLPEYLKMFYNLLLTTFKEFEDQLGLEERNQVVHVKKELGKNKGDMATTVECYMHEHKVNSEAALAHIDSFMENEWKTINQARFENDASGFLKTVINFAAGTSLFYGRNKEGYTFGTQLQEALDSLYVKSILM